MARYLVNFGDSWAAGSDTNSHPVRNLNLQYSYQLSQLTDRQLIDLSQGSTSAAHMILQFQHFIKNYYQPNNDYLAIFFITAQERQLAFDSSERPREIHPGHDDCQQYYRDIYTNQLGEFTLNTTVLTLQSLAKYYQVKDRYLLGWQQPKLWPEVDLSRFYQEGQATAMGLLGGTKIINCGHDGNTNFIAGDGHPSVEGHTRIAQALNEWLTTNPNSV